MASLASNLFPTILFSVKDVVRTQFNSLARVFCNIIKAKLLHASFFPSLLSSEASVILVKKH